MRKSVRINPGFMWLLIILSVLAIGYVAFNIVTEVKYDQNCIEFCKGKLADNKDNKVLETDTEIVVDENSRTPGDAYVNDSVGGNGKVYEEGT